MKEKIHPDYHTNHRGDDRRHVLETKSTWGKEGASLRLDIDPKTHPAWTGVRQSIDRGGRVQRFKNRFGMIGDAGVGAGAKAASPAKAGRRRSQEEVATRSFRGFCYITAAIPIGRRRSEIR